MATEDQIEETCEDLQDTIDQAACDTQKFSQEDSARIYEALANHCMNWAREIRSEMDS